MPINPVQRHQVGIAQALGQPRLQGLLNVFTGGHHRQEMRFVSHQQVFINMQHGFFEGDRRLRRHLTKVMHLEPFAISRRHAERLPLSVQHPPPGNPFLPHRWGNRREVRAQTLKHRRPVATRQMQGAGAHIRGGSGFYGHQHTQPTGSGKTQDTPGPRLTRARRRVLQRHAKQRR